MRVVSMPSMGNNGRFGNQLFQYFYMRILSESHEATIKLPKWLGSDVFNLNEAPCQETYIEYCEDTWIDARPGSRPVEPIALLQTIDVLPLEIELWGYFQLHTSCYRPYKALFDRIFSPALSLEHYLAPYLRNLFRSKSVIAIHLRRGDFGYGIYYRAPIHWYREWLFSQCFTSSTHVIYISSDESVDCRERFLPYTVVTQSELGPKLPQQLSLLLDFLILARADVLCISNSSFSFSASLFNYGKRLTLRPDIKSKNLVNYDPWNSEVLERVELSESEHRGLR